MTVKVQPPESLEGKTLLVSGAAGFIPSTLCEFYLNKGATVIGLDNYITGSHSNIDDLSKYDKFEFYETDISERLPQELKKKHIDYIFSLASPASPLDFGTIPMEIMRVNSEGTYKLLELARDKKARFLGASTSEIYGDPEVHPQPETYFGNVNSIGPRACYDESKRFAEAMIMTYHNHYDVETRIVRIFNTYGPRMRANDGRVIPSFINWALNDEDICIFGDGSQTRSFCYVTDLIDAINNVMFSDDHTPFNCGNNDEYTIKQCAELIVKVTGSSSKIKYEPLPKDDPKRRKPDLSKLQGISTYDPRITFEEGLKLTASYFKQQLLNK